jgi:hypothetical protein
MMVRIPATVVGGVFINAAIAASAVRPASSNASQSSISMSRAHASRWASTTPKIGSDSSLGPTMRLARALIGEGTKRR